MKPAEFLASVRAKQRARYAETPATPAPKVSAKASKLTLTEATTALEAAQVQLWSGSPTIKTLNRFHFLLEDAAAGGVVTKLPDGPQPVTVAEVDAAIEDLAEIFGQDSQTVRVFKKARELLVGAEEKAAALGNAPVTRAEFDALANALAIAITALDDRFHDPRAGTLELRLNAAALAGEFKSAAPGIQDLQCRLKRASEADGARQRRHASGRLQVYGANGRNY